MPTSPDPDGKADVSGYQPDFWARVDKTGPCWEWTGSRNTRGYGRASCGGRMWLAHRLAWTLARGAIPDGLEMDHLCRNHSCVRPSHLEPVTRSENIRRGIGPQVLSKMWAAQTTCKQGHPFDEVNTYRPPSGRRMCRTCMTTASREYQRRKAQKVSA